MSQQNRLEHRTTQIDSEQQDNNKKSELPKELSKLPEDVQERIRKAVETVAEIVASAKRPL
jgi:F0F1-type ATP synthase membrane subunit b/b'